MNQHWKKQGLVYSLPLGGLHPKLQTHVANPLPVHLYDDVYRVFFSARDADNRSSVGAVDLDLCRLAVVQEHRIPFFQHGPTGSFYADGVSVGNCYQVGTKRYILFMGWQAPKEGHWRGDIGRLELKDDLSLVLDSSNPFMCVDGTDPISLSYPWVLERPEGGYDMWYGSTLNWDAGNGEMTHVIHHASSQDGDSWIRQGLAVPYQMGVAQAFSRPTVLRTGPGDLEMWFSYRSGNGTPYRIGKAISRRNGAWQLSIETSGIGVSANGWDSDMIEYPFVLEHRNRRYMFYNGNGYGKTGFGVAVQSL